MRARPMKGSIMNQPQQPGMWPQQEPPKPSGVRVGLVVSLAAVVVVLVSAASFLAFVTPGFLRPDKATGGLGLASPGTSSSMPSTPSASAPSPTGQVTVPTARAPMPRRATPLPDPSPCTYTPDPGSPAPK